MPLHGASRRLHYLLDKAIERSPGRIGIRSIWVQAVALDEAVRRWSSRIAGRKAVTVGLEFGVVRQLRLYRRRNDPSGYVPEHALAPVKESLFLPYIFSQEEVLRLLHAASEHHGRWIW